MSIIVNTQSEFLREPNLLIPGKKPVNAVKVDFGHPIAKACSAFFCPTPNNMSELVTGQKPSVMTGAWEVCNEGIGWRTSADGHYIKYSYTPGFSIDGDFTLMWRGYLYGEVSGIMGFMGNRAGSYDNGEWSLYSNGDASGDEVILRIKGGGSLYTVFNTSSTWPAVHPELYTMIITQKASGTWKLYIQYGSSLYTEADTEVGPFPFTTLGNDLYINEQSDVGTDGLDAIYLCGGIWQRALTESEVQEMKYDPYQLLIPA